MKFKPGKDMREEVLKLTPKPGAPVVAAAPAVKPMVAALAPVASKPAAKPAKPAAAKPAPPGQIK